MKYLPFVLVLFLLGCRDIKLLDVALGDKEDTKSTVHTQNIDSNNDNSEENN